MIKLDVPEGVVELVMGLNSSVQVVAGRVAKRYGTARRRKSHTRSRDRSPTRAELHKQEVSAYRSIYFASGKQDESLVAQTRA